MDELETYVVNGSEITLDERLLTLNGSMRASTVNNGQLVISAYRPTADDEVCMSIYRSSQTHHVWTNYPLSCTQLTVIRDVRKGGMGSWPPNGCMIVHNEQYYSVRRGHPECRK